MLLGHYVADGFPICGALANQQRSHALSLQGVNARQPSRGVRDVSGIGHGFLVNWCVFTCAPHARHASAGRDGYGLTVKLVGSEIRRFDASV
jgi:hypothetical protein